MPNMPYKVVLPPRESYTHRTLQKRCILALHGETPALVVAPGGHKRSSSFALWDLSGRACGA